MHVLFCSNYSTQSGYSNIARLFVPRIVAAGHRVDVLELGGTGMARRDATPGGGSVQILPTILDPIGNDSVLEHARKLRVDAVLSLVDVWALKPEIWSQLPFYPLTPVDHMPVPPAVVHSLSAARAPIAFSRFGVEQLRHAGFKPFYVPHAVDPSIFHPMDKQMARRALNVPADAFWVSFVGVNDNAPSRKGIPELLAAWSVFHRSHADARLYLHTAEQGDLPVRAFGVPASTTKHYKI